MIRKIPGAKAFYISFFIFGALCLGLNSNLSLACSSCGTGGDDPLILNPMDRTRVYLGLTQTNFQNNVSRNSDLLAINGVLRRQRTVLTFGQRLDPQSFVTLSLPMITNYGADHSKSGFGDPSLAARYTFYQQTFAQAQIPQVQGLLGYTAKYADSINTTSDQREFLDAFGTGFHQMRLGFDLWQGIHFFQYGLGYNLIHAFPATYYGEKIAPGLSHISNITFGVANEKMRLIGGVVRTYKQNNTIEGQVQSRTDSLSHNVFLTSSYKPTLVDEIRVTFVDGARVLSNYNTSTSRSLTLAYMRTL